MKQLLVCQTVTYCTLRMGGDDMAWHRLRVAYTYPTKQSGKSALSRAGTRGKEVLTSPGSWELGAGEGGRERMGLNGTLCATCT